MARQPCNISDGVRGDEKTFGPPPVPPMPQRFVAPASQEGIRGIRAPRRRLLAYGDSLTAGYHSEGLCFAPYAQSLVESLAKAGVAVEIVVCGLSGLTAKELALYSRAPQISDVVDRTGMGLEFLLLTEGPFDLVLLMAGTNDLGRSEPADHVVECIQMLHAACHSRGVPTVALGVPPNQAANEWNPNYFKSWQQVNQLLQGWAQSLFVDTHELLPYARGSELWEADGLHLSRAGSRLLGLRLAPIIASIILALPKDAGDAPWGALNTYLSPAQASVYNYQWGLCF